MNRSERKFPISVIVPVFNAEKRLRACLDALTAQTFGDWELILIDDGSQDRSAEICREYRATFPERVVLLEGPNRGVSRARNRGLDAARGDWIAFCDADDAPEPRWLELLYANAARDHADLSCCAFREIGPGESRIRTNCPVAGEKRILDGAEEVRRYFLMPLFAGDPSVHGYLFASLFRRDLIEENRVRFTPGVAMKEDELFYMDYLGGARRITAAAEPLYRYIRGGEFSATNVHRNSGDFRREKNWMLYAKSRLGIFRKYGLAAVAPELERELLLRFFAHRVQMISCDPGKSFFRKLRDLAGVAGIARGENLLPRSASGKLFLFALFHCRVLLPAICAAQRRRRSS